jgi:hypothetical protein
VSQARIAFNFWPLALIVVALVAHLSGLVSAAAYWWALGIVLGYSLGMFVKAQEWERYSKRSALEAAQRYIAVTEEILTEHDPPPEVREQMQRGLRNAQQFVAENG